MNTSRFSNVFFAWLPFAILATLSSGLIYVSAQQIIRGSANDPQVQIAEDVSSALASGVTPESIVTGSQVIDIEKSLYPFLIIYDAEGKPLAGTGTLNGTLPTPPSGVLQFAKDNIENRITWEPKPAVRHAIVVRYISSEEPKFVLIGRSLREIENQAEKIRFFAGTVWIVSLLGTLGAVLLARGTTKK